MKRSCLRIITPEKFIGSWDKEVTKPQRKQEASPQNVKQTEQSRIAKVCQSRDEVEKNDRDKYDSRITNADKKHSKSWIFDVKQQRPRSLPIGCTKTHPAEGNVNYGFWIARNNEETQEQSQETSN